MKEIIKRAQSPVVVAQLVTILGSLVVTFKPELAGSVAEIVYALTIIVNVLAGLNNPTDKEKF